MNIECCGGLVCGRVADEHGFEAVGELKASVDPFVLWGLDDVAHNPLHGRVCHAEGLGRQKAAIKMMKREVKNKK